MSEERIRIIEKKVDLLYRMHMDSNFGNNLDEFIPLFNLSAEMEETEIKGFIIEELIEKQEKAKKELDKLKYDYEAGDFLAKEEEKTKTLIYNQEEKYKALIEIGEDYFRIKGIEEKLRERLLRINLKEKLGISLEDEKEYNLRYKEKLEEDLKDAIDWLQESLKEYKKKFK